MMQLKDSRCLRCDKVIQHTQCTDNHATQQQPAQINLCIEHLEQEKRVLISRASETRDDDKQSGQHACDEQHEDHADHRGMCLEVPAISQVEGHSKKDDGTRDAYAQRVFASQNMRNDKTNDHHQAESHAEKRAQSLPAADDENSDDKDSRKP